MALWQMGLKSPCFSVLACTPKRASKRLATHLFNESDSTPEGPVTQKTLYFPYPEVVSPRTRIYTE